MEKDLIVPFLYTSSSIPEVLEKYSLHLRDSKDLDSILHANKIDEYRNLVLDKNFTLVIRTLFDKIYDVIEKNFPELKFYIEGRRKALISSEAKITHYLDKNRSLDELRDFLAFRIIILGKNSLETIENCYKLTKLLIDFMILEGYTPCSATETLDTNNFTNDMHILVPEKSFLDTKHIHLVKDYVMNPKENGYQSLHVVFRDSFGRCFELQVRTHSMHMNAEIPDIAGHDAYKLNRYSNTQIEFDRDKINIDGYGTMNGHLFDFIGLENGLRILQRQKTF